MTGFLSYKLLIKRAQHAEFMCVLFMLVLFLSLKTGA